MKKGILVVAVLAALIGGFFAFSKPADENNNTQMTQKVTEVKSINEVKAAVAAGGQLLDVRTPEEYAAGHIDGAVNVPLQDLQAGKLPSAAKDKKIFVYCHSGNRSGQATTILKGDGYADITDLGAITHVQSLGGKLVTGS